MMSTPRVLPKAQFQSFLDALWRSGRTVLGPVERDGCVDFDEIRHTDELPIGRRDRQEPGRYRLMAGEPGEIFGVVHGPTSAKRHLFAPIEPLVDVRVDADGLHFRPIEPEAPFLVIVGLRACDIAAVAVQDRVFLQDGVRDAAYAVRRERIAFVAVHCTRSLPTCFCTSMGTGPRAQAGFDLGLTELKDDFVVEIGSDLGHSLLASLDLGAAPDVLVEQAQTAIDTCAAAMPQRLATEGLAAALLSSHEHPRWDDVAARCLSCGNCTMVCPTCFCHGIEDVTAIHGRESTRVRQWASCFDPGHGQIHGMNFRPHVRDRYRMWLTHKLATWQEQFGTSGCVGCGRCATWCPAGIDLVDECNALRLPSEHA